MKTAHIMRSIAAAVAVTAICAPCVHAAASSSNEFKVMSFNIRHCQGTDGKLDVGRVAAAIKGQSPDYVCLQEVDVRTKRSAKVDQAAKLAELTGMKSTFAKAIKFNGGEYGVAILARDKPLNVAKIALPGKEPRVLLVCEFKDFSVATAHLSVGGAKEREKAIPIIKKAFAKASAKPVFFTGDWNATPDSAVLKELGSFLTILSPQKGVCTFHGSGAKDPNAKLKDYCIDYVAVDTAHAKRFKVKSAKVVEDRKSSDHAPLVVTLRK